LAQKKDLAPRLALGVFAQQQSMGVEDSFGSLADLRSAANIGTSANHRSLQPSL
jgi:hypothetical protein